MKPLPEPSVPTSSAEAQIAMPLPKAATAKNNLGEVAEVEGAEGEKSVAAALARDTMD